jgi:hypothetical protein
VFLQNWRFCKNRRFSQKLVFFAKRKLGKKIFAKSDFRGYDTRISFFAKIVG